MLSSSRRTAPAVPARIERDFRTFRRDLPLHPDMREDAEGELPRVDADFWLHHPDTQEYTARRLLRVLVGRLVGRAA